MTWQTTQALLYTLAAEDARRPASICTPCLLFNPSTFPRGALDSQQHLCAQPVPIRSQAKPLDRDRIFVPVSWDSWGKTIVVCDSLDAKAWGQVWGALSIVWRRNWLGQQHQWHAYPSLVQDQDPKVHASTSPHALNMQQAPLSSLNNPTPEQTFLEKLR